MEFDLFKPRTNDAQQQRAATIKAWVTEIFGAAAETTILVTETQCDVPGCAPIETVIALFVANDDESYIEQMKVFKPLAEVTRDDIEQLAFEEELQEAFEDDVEEVEEVEEVEDGDMRADAWSEGARPAADAPKRATPARQTTGPTWTDAEGGSR